MPVCNRTRAKFANFPSTLKETVSRDFLPLFFAQKTQPGSHMKRLKRFHELFCFREDYKIRKLRVRVQTFFFYFRFSTVKNIAIGFVNTHKYLFLADCSFKVLSGLQHLPSMPA